MKPVSAFIPVVAWAILILLALTGCATVPAPVPVPVACAPDVGPEPVYPDTAAALMAAEIVPDVQLLLAGRELRDARIVTLKDALASCAGH